MRTSVVLLGLALAPCLAFGQGETIAVAPVSATGLNLSFLNGTFQYGVNLSEIFQTGYLGNGDVAHQTNISGDVAYTTRSELRPFSLIYSGGVQLTNQTGIGNTFFQSLAVSQGYNTKNWAFSVADVVSYLPQSPTVGLSGVPGTGDLGLFPLEGVNSPSQSVLTYNETRVSNSVSGSVSRRIGAHNFISGDANYGLLHFFDQSALDTTQTGADVSLNRTFDPRTSGAVIASYSIFHYSTGDSSFQTRGISARVSRQISRYFSASASGGPLWIDSSSNLGIPSRLSASASLSLLYTRPTYNAGLYYSRGANGGSGVQPGAISDSVGATYFRSFGRNWSTSLNVGYSHTEGLSQVPTPVTSVLYPSANLGNYNSLYAGVQASRRLGEHFSAFAGYSASHQTYDRSPNVTNPYALDGLLQSFSIGVSFFPRSVHLGQF